MLLSDYIWGRGKGLELSLWWYAPFNRIIPPHLHISAERLESKNFLFSLPSPLFQSQSRLETRDWTGDLLTHLITQTRVFISILHHPLLFLFLEDSEEHKRRKREDKRNRFDSFSRFPRMHLKRTIIFPLFIFASDRGIFSLSLCLKRIIFSNDATPLHPPNIFSSPRSRRSV